ncbi:OmpA family protein [Paraflavitalea sp. CAU 1676]|uniref:OmpA family protein n=1 Tax=Paraflavitalea sp. CAU 1676 TaxID=3032598 RepID=UPI0023DB9D9C|nr:OmpA family protein [Paraflavitalea sp. CAU 1676]MDF2189768.1 OmpA family protein [Paraflavitalea sp. CAU 1676]
MKSYSLLALLTLAHFQGSSQTGSDSLLVHFEYNRSEVNATAARQLDSLLKVVPAARVVKIHLTGHCDFIGSHVYNDSLSQERLKMVRAYLLRKGISASVFREESAKGKREPLIGATTDEARAMNRRVSVIYTWQAPNTSPIDVVASPAQPASSQTVSTPAVKPATGPAPATLEPEVVSRRLPAAKTALSALITDTATKVGSTLVLPDLNFEPGRHFLMSGSYGVLRELYRVMKDFPSLQIEIQGHICCLYGGIDGQDIDTGDPDLSVQRAKSIYEYLVLAGIDGSRMRYKGFGSSQKLFPGERTPAEQAKNRRVEIKIISK